MNWVIWLLAIFFYFYEFFVRVGPSVMIPELMQAFHISGGQVGAISASYFYAYAIMQLPVGMLMDRFGPKVLLTIASVLCGLSSILFGMAEGKALAYIARIIMGGSSAFGFVGMIYVSAQFFPKARTAFLIGFGESLGVLGAVFGESLFGFFVKDFGWRSSSIAIGFVGLILGLLILCVMKGGKPVHTKGTVMTLKTLIEALRVTFATGQMWLLALVAWLCYSTINAFGSLWGNSFLKTNYGYGFAMAGFAASMIFLGRICGGPIIGYVGKKVHHKKQILFLCSILSALALFLLIYSPLPIHWVFATIFFVGFLSAAQLYNYGIAIEINPTKAKATAVAFVNFVVFIGSSVLQPFIGWLLDFFWDGTVQGGVAVYSPRDYRYALTILPVTYLVACILVFFIHSDKENRKKPFFSVR